jgi:hypothetical protein
MQLPTLMTHQPEGSSYIEVLTNKVLEDNQINFDIKMERVVGASDIVEADDGDEIVYAVRKNRNDNEIYLLLNHAELSLVLMCPCRSRNKVMAVMNF